MHSEQHGSTRSLGPTRKLKNTLCSFYGPRDDGPNVDGFTLKRLTAELCGVGVEQLCNMLKSLISMGRKVSLFVPCFVDQLVPEVAVDTVKVLRRIGCEVDFPEDQTCCGQPAFNTGYWDDARPCAERYVRVFKDAEVIVCPSGSCTTMVRNFYPELLKEGPMRADAVAVGFRTYELSEFLVKVAGVTDVGAVFPHTVTYHASCHGLRELHLREEPLQLLRAVQGLKLVDMARNEECCGFGGTFATKFANISAAMGQSKAESITASGAEFVTAIDPSCLMHVQGMLGKNGMKAKAIHLASILASNGGRA